MSDLFFGNINEYTIRRKGKSTDAFQKLIRDCTANYFGNTLKGVQHTGIWVDELTGGTILEFPKKELSPPTEFAIVCDLTHEVVGMGGTYENAFECALLNVERNTPHLLTALKEEAHGLRNRGKDNAGRFYTAMAEREVYLEVFLYEAEHNYKLDRNGVLRVG